MIPYGLSVDLFDGEGFNESDEPNLTIDCPIFQDQTLKHACINLRDYYFKNWLSSLEVYKTG